MTKELSLSQLFLNKTHASPSTKSIGWIKNGELNFLTNQEYFDRTKIIASGLQALGLKTQEALAIFAQTSKEWHLTDIATLCLRAVVIPIYPTYLPHEVEYISNHSEAKFLVVENESQLLKFIEVQDNVKTVTTLISFEDVPSETLKKLDRKFIFKTYQDLLELGEKNLNAHPTIIEDSIKESQPSEIASIIYTSGTTGEPKGAVITHYAFVIMLKNVKNTLKTNVSESDRTLTFLPLSHVLGRCDSMLNFVFGLECVYAESLEKVVDNLAIAKPTILLAVPRIFEKVYTKVLENIQNEGKLKKVIFQWALDASNAYYKKINSDVSPTSLEIVQKNLAYKLVFHKIYEKFGGRIRFLISGGAPLAPEIITFLQNANLTILEGYGLTETIAPCILNPVVKQVPGTIGLPLGEVKVKFAEDGEIMLKTEALFTSYYKNEAATQDAFKDGWFLTGDIGELTQEGYIKITDRKKDIIITSAGKNVAPQKIENALKLQPHIANAMVVGDKRKFLVAIISIDPEAFSAEKVNLGLGPEATYEDLAKNKQVRAMIAKEIDTTNHSLARFESIKGFILAPIDFSVENGQITPSLKLKKKVILKTYAKEVDSLYNELENENH